MFSSTYDSGFGAQAKQTPVAPSAKLREVGQARRTQGPTEHVAGAFGRIEATRDV